jgi:putative ABC transport system permease protein
MNPSALLDNAWRDLKHGARLLRLNPGFAIVAVLSLALGVGANTAIFQLLDAVRLRTLPVREPDRLVEVRIGDTPHGRTGGFRGPRPMLTNPLWEQIRDRQQVFSGAFAYGSTSFNLTTGGEARYALGLWTSGEFFTTLGVPAAIGRVLTSDDDRRGCASPPAVISYGFWQRELGGDAAVIGRTVTLDGHEYPIVGVTPASFFGMEVGRAFDVAVPLCAEPLSGGAQSSLDKADVWFLAAFGRLKPGSSIEQATAQLASISASVFKQTVPARYRAEDANNYLAFKLAAFPAGTGVSQLRRTYEAPLWLLLATTGLVLLIACANLANLMLARATTREREVAVRLAIGASRARIVRQLLAESVLIAIIGAGFGGLLALWLSDLLVGFLTTDTSKAFVVLTPDWRVFAFTAGLGVFTVVLFGLAPAIRATDLTPGAAMKAASRGATDSRERFGLRRALVVVQVAVSLVLLVGALLFVQSLRNLLSQYVGFREDGILIANLDFARTALPVERLQPTFDDIARRLATLPAAESAAQTFIVPVSGSGWNNNIVIKGKRYTSRDDLVNFNAVGPGYFKTMDTPLLAGREFDDRRDTQSSLKVAIVNELFARKFFPDRNPIGESFQIDVGVGQPQPPYEIIGVVKDTKYTDLREPFKPIGYLAMAQGDPRETEPFTSIVLRARAPMSTLAAQVTAAIRDFNPSIVVQYRTMQGQIRSSLVRERLMATLSGLFGVLAAVIATVGLYGVMAYTVARRRNEIGIRVALGASRYDVVRMVMSEAGVLVTAGLVIGAALAIAAARTAGALLFGLPPGDPTTLAAAVAALGAVAILAAYFPALRAARLEPTEALREE